MEGLAVLASGGLDSAVLLADLARQHEVFPLYVEEGLGWEPWEKGALQSWLEAVGRPGLHPLTVLQMPVGPLYGDHWSVTGRDVPGYEAPDSDVCLPGRNVLLLGVAAVWCALRGIHGLALGSLEHNPFPDATPAFFEDYGALLSRALGHDLRILAPYRHRRKSELLAAFADLPLHLTLTCMRPTGPAQQPVHCGNCNKCRERQEAFREAGLQDRTTYAPHPHLGSYGTA